MLPTMASVGYVKMDLYPDRHLLRYIYLSCRDRAQTRDMHV